MTEQVHVEPYELRRADEWRRFEIELFWKRSGGFWLVLAAAFAGFGWSIAEGQFLLAFAVAGVGWGASLAWTLANRGSKYWYENWEEHLKAEEFRRGVILYAARAKTPSPPRTDSGLTRLTNAWLRGRRFSVSALLIALSDYALIVWSGALFYAFGSVCQVQQDQTRDKAVAAVFLLITGVWGAATLRGTSRRSPD